MRHTASILHVDLDAFFAAVEQRDKPSLKNKPVVVGGVGMRGVVSTASYEARVFGVRSAMSMAEARSRCPHAAFLTGRFSAYREASDTVMKLLQSYSPVIQPLSLDEAFVDLRAIDDFDQTQVECMVQRLRREIAESTGGLTASVGVASSKLMAKIATEFNKPDGYYIVEPGAELQVLGPLQVTAIPGVGPATAERLHRIGIYTVENVRQLSQAELIEALGTAGGRSLFSLARAEDNRSVESHRESKSISVEDTFASDIADRRQLEALTDKMARTVARRLNKDRHSARTITIKVRLHDFETRTRSSTLAAPTDDARVISKTARQLLAGSDITGGVRLLGVGVSSLARWVQDDLFADDLDDEVLEVVEPEAPERIHWRPGMDVHHRAHGDGWVWGAGLARVTVRFETRWTGPGPVHTFREDDPALSVGHFAPTDTVEP